MYRAEKACAERRTSNGFTEGTNNNWLHYTTFNRWQADKSKPERWATLGLYSNWSMAANILPFESTT